MSILEMKNLSLRKVEFPAHSWEETELGFEQIQECILVKEDLTLSRKSQNQGSLDAWRGGEDSSLSSWDLLPSPLFSNPILNCFPSSLVFSSLFSGYMKNTKTWAKGPPSAQSRDGRPGAGGSRRGSVLA